MVLRTGLPALWIVTVFGCASVSDQKPPVWTDKTLFDEVVSMYTRPPGGLSGYTAFNGRDLAAINVAFDFLGASGDKHCGKINNEDHYVFVKRSGSAVSIVIAPAWVPDSERISGLYPQPDGRQRLVVAGIEGARRLNGCTAQLESIDNGLSFRRVDEFARQ